MSDGIFRHQLLAEIPNIGAASIQMLSYRTDGHVGPALFADRLISVPEEFGYLDGLFSGKFHVLYLKFTIILYIVLI